MSFVKYLTESSTPSHAWLKSRIKAGVRSKISLEEMAKVLKLDLTEDQDALLFPGWYVDSGSNTDEFIDKETDRDAAMAYFKESLGDIDDDFENSGTITLYQLAMDEDGDETHVNEVSFRGEMNRGRISLDHD